MPTLKADIIAYDEELSERENINRLFEAHNAFARRMERTVNNLDEDNFNTSVLQALKGESNSNE